jgi:hypothetical protein
MAFSFPKSQVLRSGSDADNVPKLLLLDPEQGNRIILGRLCLNKFGLRTMSKISVTIKKLTFESLLVVCTNRLRIDKFLTLFLCVLYLSENKP